MEREQPIIVKIESQKCVGYRQAWNGHVTIVENIGFDKAGHRWRFVTETTCDARGMEWFTEFGRNFVQLD